MVLANRDLATQLAALRAEFTSSTAASDLRIAALASAYDLRIATLAAAHDLRIKSLASRPSDLAAYVAPLALVEARVASLGAAPADLLHDDGEAAFVFTGLRLAEDEHFTFIDNVKIAGKVKSEDFEFLEPSAKDELNKIESARCRAGDILPVSDRAGEPKPPSSRSDMLIDQKENIEIL